MDGATLLALTSLSQLSSSLPQLLSTVTLTATSASVTYTVVTPYPRILCNWGGICTATGSQTLLLQFNGDTAAHYGSSYIQNASGTVTGSNASAATSAQVGIITATNGTADYWASGSFLVDGANQSTHFPTITSTITSFFSSSTSFAGIYGGLWTSATPITSLTVFPFTGSFAAGSSFSFYGLS